MTEDQHDRDGCEALIEGELGDAAVSDDELDLVVLNPDDDPAKAKEWAELAELTDAERTELALIAGVEAVIADVEVRDDG